MLNLLALTPIFRVLLIGFILLCTFVVSTSFYASAKEDSLTASLHYKLLEIDQESFTCWVKVSLTNKSDQPYQLVMLRLAIYLKNGRYYLTENQPFTKLKGGEIRQQTVSFGSRPCSNLGTILLAGAECIISEENRLDPSLCRKKIKLNGNRVLVLKNFQ